MPKRRRKSTFAQKPSLLFTESPVHVQKNVPSPVLCARHPPTADSVPVEELDSLTWVSPQFQKLSHSGVKTRRQVRQRRHSIATHKCHQLSLSNDKENHCVPQPYTKLRKFNSLKFVGEKTYMPSVIEDVEISFDSETAPENEVPDQIAEISENESPSVDLNKNGKNNRDQHLSLTGHRLTLSINENRHHFNTGNNEKCSSSELDTTGRLERESNKAPVKRLFASQLAEIAKAADEIENVFNDNNGDVDINVTRTNVEFVKQNQENNIEPSDDEIDFPKVRRSRRIKKCKGNFNLELSQLAGREGTVKMLAPDTPESEYGLTLKQRQLAKLKKKKS